MGIRLGDGRVIDVGPEDFEEIDLDEEFITFEGERLTEARAAEIAREVARRHGLRGGRPRKPDSERASVQKAVRLTPELAEQLRGAAAAQHVTEATVIRNALEAYLAA